MKCTQFATDVAVHLRQLQLSSEYLRVKGGKDMSGSKS
jgi:hypothetical protein